MNIGNVVSLLSWSGFLVFMARVKGSPALRPSGTFTSIQAFPIFVVKMSPAATSEASCKGGCSLEVRSISVDATHTKFIDNIG